MRLKLVSAQEIFKELTLGELPAVETAARRMLAFNLLEQWAARRSFRQRSEYQKHLNAFEFSVKELVRTSEAGETEGALDAYVGMSRSCVNCHQLIRDKSGAVTAP